MGRPTDVSGVTVVAVSGSAAAGAPRLAAALAERSGAFLVGDLRKVWTRGLRVDQPCGCGESFRGCAFWREVGQVAFGGWDRVDRGRRRHAGRCSAPSCGGRPPAP